MAKKKVAKKATKKITKTKTKVIKKKSVVVKGDLIVHNPTNPTQEFVVASEFADDEAIEGELMGKAMEHYVYSFCEYHCKEKCDHKKITGLTVAGVNEMSRQLTKKKNSGIKIRIVPDSIKIERNVEENGQKGVGVILIAENMLSGETAIGAKFEPYQKMSKKNGAYDNTFAMEKAVSKAERNAKRKLIPEKVAIEMIKLFVNDGKVKELAQPVQRQIQAPAQVNYLGKLITMLANEAGITIKNGVMSSEDLGKMIDIYNLAVGSNIRSFKVSQEQAQKLLLDYVNSPVIANK